MDKRSSSVWPGERENSETLILPCHYRKGYTPKKPLGLVAAAKLTETKQHSAMPVGDVNPASPVPVTPVLPVPSTLLRHQTLQVLPSPDSCASSHSPNDTGRVHTSTKSKPCSPDNLVRKNCEASVLHMNILIFHYYSSCCLFVVFT